MRRPVAGQQKWTQQDSKGGLPEFSPRVKFEKTRTGCCFAVGLIDGQWIPRDDTLDLRHIGFGSVTSVSPWGFQKGIYGLAVNPVLGFVKFCNLASAADVLDQAFLDY